MNKITNILLLLIVTLTLTTCNREDDLDEIFVGKTWYMNGGKFNGKAMNTDVKNFYNQKNTYYITFKTESTFQGMLNSGATFSGKWSADGKKHNIYMQFDSKPQISSDFDQQIYNVLKAVTSYDSGATFIFLKQDKDNMVMFGITRDLPHY